MASRAWILCKRASRTTAALARSSELPRWAKAGEIRTKGQRGEQAEGTVSKGRSGVPMVGGDDTTTKRDADPGDDITRISSVKDIAPDFYSNGSEMVHLTDDVTDEQFEDALTEAKDEGNVSRANVVRKIKAPKESTFSEQQTAKWDRVTELAATGSITRQTRPSLPSVPKQVLLTARPACPALHPAYPRHD